MIGRVGEQLLTYPVSLATKLKICSSKTFFKCIDELTENGFVEIVEQGKFNHKPNKYKFIEEWKNKS